MPNEQNATSQFSFDRDLENARVLIEDSPWRDNPQKYRKVAEGILRRILRFDPKNESAKRLLAKAETAKRLLAKAETPAPEIASPPRPAASQDLSFVVQKIGSQINKEEKEASRPPRALVSLAALAAVAGLLVILVHSNTFKSQYAPKAVIAATSPLEPTLVSAPVIAVSNPNPVPAPKTAPAVRVVEPTTPPVRVVERTTPPVAPIVTGTLAVSSPTNADIYMAGRLMGSAPTTLVLPAGKQRLEYRHQGLRKVVTHVIKPNETTTAMVTFDVPVQINARPWANVFVDGSQRQALGQTPLSDVRVPIGSLLIFENPNFAGKNYRVIGTETEIRVSFP